MENKNTNEEIVLKGISYLGTRVQVAKVSGKEYAQRVFLDKNYKNFSMFVDLTPEVRQEATKMQKVDMGNLVVTPYVSRSGNLELRFVRFESQAAK
jgi:hypothetical protein